MAFISRLTSATLRSHTLHHSYSALRTSHFHGKCFALREPAFKSHDKNWRRFSDQSQSSKEGATMGKIWKIGLSLLLSGSALTSVLYAQENESRESQLIHVLNAKVLETIEHSQEIPGLKAEEFDALKPEIVNLWNKIVQKGALEIHGTDEDIRPYFVALQGVIEHVLSSALNEEVGSLAGMIHTPMPATPLCTKGEISPGLVDSSLETDPKRLFTVKARPMIIRDFLNQGGRLFAVYPKGGLEKRTHSQQSIYKQELETYPNHLRDCQLTCSSIPEELIGATYLFTDRSGRLFAFALKITQAKDPKEAGNFGLWFGSMQNEAISNRVNAVTRFIEANRLDFFFSSLEIGY